MYARTKASEGFPALSSGLHKYPKASTIVNASRCTSSHCGAILDPSPVIGEEDHAIHRSAFFRVLAPAAVSTALLSLVGLGLLWAQTAVFPGPIYLDSPGHPADVTVVDLDGDGVLDLLIAGRDAGSLFLRLGLGGLRFGSPRGLTLAGRPSRVAVADLDHQLGLDLVWTDEGAGVLYWAVASGDPTLPYENVSLHREGEEVTGLATADLNGDGWEDVVVSVGGGDELAFHFNDGSGGLLPAVHHRAGDRPTRILVATAPDTLTPRLIVMQEGALARDVAVYDGSIPVLTQRIPVEGPRWIELAPWDLDGQEDLLVIAREGSSLQIHRRQSDGSFSRVRETPIAPGSAAVTSLESFGPLRRLVVAEAAKSRVTLFEGIPGEGLMARQSWFVGPSIRQILHSDLDGDGRVELIVPLPDEDRIAVIEQSGAGLLAYSSVPTGSSSTEVQYTPATAVQPARVAVLGPVPPAIRIYEPFDNSLRQVTAVPGSRGLHHVHWIDVDRDGWSDPVVLRDSVGVEEFRADKGGGFVPGWTLSLAGDLKDLAAGDIDGDGWSDLAVADASGSRILTFLNDRAGGFTAADVVVMPVAPTRVVLADLNEDGKSDLLLLDGTTFLSLLFRGADSFGSPVRMAVGGNPRQILTGDINGDGALDLVIAGTTLGGSYTSYVTRAPGVFELASFSETLVSGFVEARLGEVSGDGILDLIIASISSSDGLVLRQGLGDGTFDLPFPIPAASIAVAVAAGEIDGDGTTDLMVLDGLSASMTLLLQNPASLVPVAGRLLAARIDERVRIIVESSLSLRVIRERDRKDIDLTPAATGRWEGWDADPGRGPQSYALLSPGGDLLDRVEVGASPAASRVRLAEPFPNPARGAVSIRFRLPGGGGGSLRLGDARGRVVAHPAVRTEGGGWWVAAWNGRDATGEKVARGRYFVDLTVGGRRFSRSLVWTGP